MVEPFGGERDDYRVAYPVARLAAMFAGRNSRLKVDDFIAPQYRSDAQQRTRKPLTSVDQWQRFAGIITRSVQPTRKGGGV